MNACPSPDDLLAMFVAFFCMGLLLGLIFHAAMRFIESASTVGTWPGAPQKPTAKDRNPCS